MHCIHTKIKRVCPNRQWYRCQNYDTWQQILIDSLGQLTINFELKLQLKRCFCMPLFAETMWWLLGFRYRK